MKRVCKNCGTLFDVPHYNPNAKFCSRKCADIAKIREPNVVCANCGKAFHLKPYRIKRAKTLCCSKKCSNEIKHITFVGDNNHQFGLKGKKNASFKIWVVVKKNNRLVEKLIYVGEWYKKQTHSGYRIPEHRYLVEKNWNLFNKDYFEEIDGWHYLKKEVDVHHLDFNHNNNELSNLMPMLRSEHRSLHVKLQNQKRDSNGRFTSNDTK